MKISNAAIKNFRGLEDYQMSPAHVNVFVGPCGSGKSSVLNAIRFALTGTVDGSDIKEGASSASVLIELEDGTNFERKRTEDGTTVKVNGKRATAKALNELIEAKFGVSCDILEAVTSVDYFEALSQKDLTSLFLSILPVQITFDGMCEMMEKMRKKALTDEEKALLQEQFPNDGSTYGLEEIDSAYNAFFERRKAAKILLKAEQTKAIFEGTLPSKTKEELEKELFALAKKEADNQTHLKRVQDYEASVKAREQAQLRLDSLKKELEAYASVSKPEETVLTQAKVDKEKFLGAISQAENSISTINANVSLFQRTLDSLDKPVCPISEKLVCTTDKTGLKNELGELLAQNAKAVKDWESLVTRCREQVVKRDKIMEEYQRNQMAYVKKESLEKQIAEFILPALLEKPAPVAPVDVQKEKEEINNALRLLASYEATQKAKAAADIQEKKVKLLEFALEVLDVKKGVRAKIMENILKPLETMCNQKAAKLRKDFLVKFDCTNGISVLVQPRANASFVPRQKVSTGEFVFVAYLLMSVINEISRAPFLIIDSLDKLDKDAMGAFMTLLEGDVTFDNIFVGAVDHEDTKKLLKASTSNVLTLK